VSLLMDALKKAEREKKEAAKRLKESQERSGDLTLEEATPRSEAEAEAEASAESQQPEITADQPEQQEKSAGDLSLSPIEDDIDTEAPTQKIDLSKMKDPGTSGLSLEDKNDLTLDQPDLAEPVEDEETDEETGPEEPVFAINSLSTEEDYISPLEDSGLHDLPEQTLEDSGIISRSLDEGKTLQSALSAEELARDMGDDPNAPLPVAAQTVFNASASQSSKRQFMEWFLFVACFAVLIVAGSIFYYLKTTPEISPPIRPQLADTETATVEQITEQAQVSSDVSGEFTSTETGQEIVLDDSAAQTASIGIPEKPVAIEVADKETIALQQPLPQPKQGQENILPDEIRVEPRVLQISRSRAVRESDLLVHDAYADYKAGDFDSAAAAYRKVLITHPENRDALLGLAAIAQNRGNQQQANQYYLRVLKNYPSDVIAKAALLASTNNKGSAVENESLLKSMISDSPDTADLHFILGNVFASTSRWNDAQQSFFEAFRLDNENANYAYNLAVSLDHLGKTQAALQYYRLAMELAESSSVTLNTNVLASRIAALSDFSQDQ
jgi:tetratricopeptide (TPR) repeat protein